ncbi:MAG: hypothetical protein IIA67_11310 [Planctomycetes bacterium]|nr:hypothetical protein [Planctomycetota bacterium]
MKSVRFVLTIAVVALLASTAAAQYSLIQNNFNTVNSSFFERQGVNFGFNIHGGGNVIGIGPDGQPTPNGDIQFRQGSFGATLPAFGNASPGAGIQSGFAILGNGGDMFFGFDFSQGSNTTNVSQSPSVVVPNGGIGFMSDTTQRPFVIGLIPVVGNGGYAPRMMSPYGLQRQLPRGGPSRLQHALSSGALDLSKRPTRRERETKEALNELHRARQRAANPLQDKIAAAARSSAGQPVASVAEIRRRQAAGAAAQQKEALSYLSRGQQAERDGKAGVAKIYYRMGLRRASGDVKARLQSKIDALK